MSGAGGEINRKLEIINLENRRTSSEQKMNYKIKTIPLSSIDSEDNSYRITTGSHIKDLVNSIDKLGLINQPLLIEKGSMFIIVCGFCRIEACCYLGWPEIEAKTLDPDTDGLECAKIAITDNVLQRQLNLIEKSRALNILSKFYKDSESLFMEASALGLPENPSLIKKIKDICNFPLPVQDCMLAGTVSLTIALDLSMLEQKAGVFLANMFHELKLSLNKQKETIVMIKEIAIRENISEMELLNKCGFSDILNNKDIDRTQKAQKIKTYLKQMRFPEITKAETERSRNIKELNLGAGINLIPPANFEGLTYMLNIKFKKIDELQKQVVKLNAIAENPILEKIIK